MSKPLVSVLMTSYNREKYIGLAIESLLLSTYTNFELIIVDDCSTDATQRIAKSFAEKDERIKLFVNERNLGQFENRNLAAKYTTGKYLKYLDSDDLIYPTGLEVLVTMMEKFPDAGYGLCSLPQDDDKIFPFMLNPKEAYERHFLKQVPLFHKAPLSSIIHKSVFDEVGGFTNPYGEGDYEMWLNLSTKYNIVLIPDGITWYRVHDEQVDFNRRNDPFLRFRYFLVTLKYLDKNCPLGPDERQEIISQTNRYMVQFILISFFKYSPQKAFQMYKSANYTVVGFFKNCISITTRKIFNRK